jgi:hypothetical protein
MYYMLARLAHAQVLTSRPELLGIWVILPTLSSNYDRGVQLQVSKRVRGKVQRGAADSLDKRGALPLSLSPFNQFQVPSPQLSRNETSKRNIGKTCASRFRCSPYQRFPCWRQAPHHRSNVHVPETSRLIRR